MMLMRTLGNYDVSAPENLPSCDFVPAGTPCIPSVSANMPQTTASFFNQIKMSLPAGALPTISAQGIVSTLLPPSTVIAQVGPVTIAFTPWYKTWWGLGLLGLAAVGGFWYFKKR